MVCSGRGNSEKNFGGRRDKNLTQTQIQNPNIQETDTETEHNLLCMYLMNIVSFFEPEVLYRFLSSLVLIRRFLYTAQLLKQGRN